MQKLQEENFENKNSDLKDLFALYPNNIKEIELQEVIDLVLKKLGMVDDLKQPDDFIIVVYWIGYCLKPKDFENLIGLK